MFEIEKVNIEELLIERRKIKSNNKATIDVHMKGRKFKNNNFKIHNSFE